MDPGVSGALTESQYGCSSERVRGKCSTICETGTGQIIQGLVSHVKDFDLPPKTSGRPLLVRTVLSDMSVF